MLLNKQQGILCNNKLIWYKGEIISISYIDKLTVRCSLDKNQGSHFLHNEINCTVKESNMKLFIKAEKCYSQC